MKTAKDKTKEEQKLIEIKNVLKGQRANRQEGMFWKTEHFKIKGHKPKHQTRTETKSQTNGQHLFGFSLLYIFSLYLTFGFTLNVPVVSNYTFFFFKSNPHVCIIRRIHHLHHLHPIELLLFLFI